MVFSPLSAVQDNFPYCIAWSEGKRTIATYNFSIDAGLGGEDELRLALDGTAEDDMLILNGPTLDATITNMENTVPDLFGRTEEPLALAQEHFDNLPNAVGSSSIDRTLQLMFTFTARL